MTVELFPRTQEQRMRSLQLANEIRFARARLKGRLRRGETTVAAIVADPPPYALTMKVAALLDAAPMWGPVRTRRTLRRLGIADLKTVGGLSGRQRRVLADYLEGR